jgi:hypothetical protein
VLAEVLEETAGEVAHIDHCFKWQIIKRADGAFRCRSGAAGEVIEATGAGDVDALMNRGDPGGAGEGVDDAGSAEDRQSSRDAKAGVPGFLGKLLAVRDRDFDLDVAAA